MIQNAKITNYLKRTGVYSITILSNEAMFGLFSFCLLQLMLPALLLNCHYIQLIVVRQILYKLNMS